MGASTYAIIVESSFIVFFARAESFIEWTIAAAGAASAASTYSTAAIKCHYVFGTDCQ